MGSAASHHKLLAEHDSLLEDLVGEKVVTVDSYWQELLSFPVPLTKLSPQDLEAAALPYCEKLVRNNSSTHNFQTLLHVALGKLRPEESLSWSAEGAQQATDAVVFVRIFIKYLVETLNADDLVAFLDPPPRAAPQRPGYENGAVESWVARICNTATQVLMHTPIRDETYLLHLETMHLLIAMISSQLFSPSAAAEPGGHPFTEVLMDSQEDAAALLRILLRHFVSGAPLPPKAPVYVPPPAERRGVLRLVRSAAASVLWLPLQALTFLVRSGNQRLADSPLSETGLLLLLALLHHAPADAHPNPFQRALSQLHFKAGEATEDDDAEAPSTSTSAAFLDFDRLFRALGRRPVHDRTVLLLYGMLHGCPEFRELAVGVRDLDTILLPLLEQLYGAAGRPASQIYMLLIVVLILSQDAAFGKRVHEIFLQSVPWYSERLLRDTSLGSLLVVILLRTAHYNLSKLKDVYLHTNTLAALANLAPHMSNLSSHAAQRLVSLLDMLARRYARLSRAGGADGSDTPLSQERQVYYDFLRIVLEIVNCVILKGLSRNPELVYALLHRQDVFAPFEGQSHFDDLLENLRLVIRFFNARIDAAREKGHFEWSVANVLRVVKDNLADWPGDHALRQFPELRFTYEEEASPEGFFVPYVWTLLVTHTTLPWHAHAIALFSPVALGGGEEATLDVEAGPPSAAAEGRRSFDAASNV